MAPKEQLAPKDRRTKLLGTLLTPAEWKKLDDRAAADGLTASSWARLVLLKEVNGDRHGN